MPTLLALAAWGRKHAPKKGTPTFTHDDCGAEVSVALRCSAGHELRTDELVVRG